MLRTASINRGLGVLVAWPTGPRWSLSNDIAWCDHGSFVIFWWQGLCCRRCGLTRLSSISLIIATNRGEGVAPTKHRLVLCPTWGHPIVVEVVSCDTTLCFSWLWGVLYKRTSLITWRHLIGDWNHACSLVQWTLLILGRRRSKVKLRCFRRAICRIKEIRPLKPVTATHLLRFFHILVICVRLGFCGSFTARLNEMRRPTHGCGLKLIWRLLGCATYISVIHFIINKNWL